MMKRGDKVTILPNHETTMLGIAGESGVVDNIDKLGRLLVVVAGYPGPFILDASEVETPGDAQMRAANAPTLPW